MFCHVILVSLLRIDIGIFACLRALKKRGLSFQTVGVGLPDFISIQTPNCDWIWAARVAVSSQGGMKMRY
jgi:hypothetical protein